MHFIIGVFLATDIGGFPYSIYNLDMIICTSTTLALTFGNIIDQYTGYVKRKYKDAIIVFDGYSGTSTKDMTHWQWAKG